MQDGRPLFVFGFREDATRIIREAAATIGLDTVAVEHCADAPSALDQGLPIAIFLRVDAPGAGPACTHVRGRAQLSHVPIFGVAPRRNDLAFTELFVWGGDDLVALGADSITRRLRGLLGPQGTGPRPEAAAPPLQTKTKPQAVVAGPEAAWRTVLGRALSNGGFAVRFATNADGLVDECLDPGLRVVVAADDLGPDGAVAALSRVRARPSDVPWVIVVPPKRMAVANAEVKPLGRASVVDGYAPPENAIFLVNELLAARGVDKRASPRLLYGTAVAFRAAGREEDEIGFSYNVSAQGVYVRTLAPLEGGQQAWLEMWPPRSERRVRLAGEVAWRRPFGPVGSATVPAGFGLRITDGLAGDLERWQAGYAAFAQSILGPPA